MIYRACVNFHHTCHPVRKPHPAYTKSPKSKALKDYSAITPPLTTKIYCPHPRSISSTATEVYMKWRWQYINKQLLKFTCPKSPPSVSQAHSPCRDSCIHRRGSWDGLVAERQDARLQSGG